LSKAVDLFKGWMISNREWISLGLEALMTGIVNGFDRFVGMLKKVGDFFKPLTDKLKEFSGGMSMMEWVMHIVTGALAGLLVIFAPVLAKFALIGAAIALASLLFEDLFSSITTGQGAFADLFREFEQRWPGLASAVKKIGTFIKENFVDAFNAVVDVLKVVAAALGDVFGQLLDGINGMVGPVGEFFATFEEKFPALFELLQTCGKFIKEFIGGAFEAAFAIIKVIVGGIIGLIEQIGSGIGKIMEGANWIADKLGLGKGKKGEPGSSVAEGQSASVPAPSAGLPNTMPMASAHGQPGTQYTDNKTINMNISTSDPQQAGQAAAAAINQGQPTATPGSWAPAY